MKKLNIAYLRSKIPVIIPVFVMISLWACSLYPLKNSIYAMLVLINGETTSEGTLLNLKLRSGRFVTKFGRPSYRTIYTYKFNISSPSGVENMEVTCEGNDLPVGSKIQFEHPVGFEKYAVPTVCKQIKTDLKGMYLFMVILTMFTVLSVIIRRANQIPFQKSYSIPEELKSSSQEWLMYLLLIFTIVLFLVVFYIVRMKMFS